MSPRLAQCHRFIRWVLLIVVALSLAGCSRLRIQHRQARRGAPVPKTPSVIEDTGSEVESAITNPSAAAPPRGRTSSAYGPATGNSFAPRGSTGSSRDIRYPSSSDARLRPIPMNPRGGNPARRDTAPVVEPAASEIPVNVPLQPKRKGANGEPSTNGASRATADEVPGIPGYFEVAPNVATGGQPTLEGMKWLKDRGFRTVLNLLPDSDADPAEASMVRNLGLEYLELSISAQTINAETVNQFNLIVDDGKYRPLFIHDSTGSRTGAMWYLHRVTVDKVPVDSARSQSARIGLKDSDTELWHAIQRHLSEQE